MNIKIKRLNFLRLFIMRKVETCCVRMRLDLMILSLAQQLIDQTIIKMRLMNNPIQEEIWFKNIKILILVVLIKNMLIIQMVHKIILGKLEILLLIQLNVWYLANSLNKIFNLKKINFNLSQMLWIGQHTRYKKTKRFLLCQKTINHSIFSIIYHIYCNNYFHICFCKYEKSLKRSSRICRFNKKISRRSKILKKLIII